MNKFFQSMFVVCIMLLATGLSAQKESLKGNGNIATEQRSVGNFDKIEIGGAWDVILEKGKEGDLTISLDENLLEHLRTEVSNGVLRISFEKHNIRNVNEMKMTIKFQDLEGIDVSGACDFVATSPIQAKDFELECSGASNIELEVSAEKFEGEFSGASKVELSGKANHANFEVSGATSVQASNFKVTDLQVDASGASSAKVNCTGKLQVDASGASSVKYSGSPSVQKNISGASSVKPAS